MSGQIDLPAIGVDVVVDDSALARTGATARTTGKQIEAGLGPGKKASEALTSGLEGLAEKFGITLPPEVKKAASALLGLAGNGTTTKATLTTLSQGAKALASDLGLSVPPEAEKATTALIGLSSTSAVTAGEVAALSAGAKTLASDLGAGVPAQAEKSSTALKGLASSGTAANAVVGLTSGAVVIVEEDLARAGNTATGTGEKIQSALETGKKASEALKTGLEGVGKGGEAAAAGGEAAAAGVGALTGAAIAGVAALTAVVVTGKSIEDSYVSIAEKVENYRRVTGASAEDSSREVQVFEELGVSADTASQAVYRFSKVVESSPDKLRALGVEIARDNEGQVDLNKTLLNTADAYVRAGSALQKDTILQTAFGRSGRDMIPILEQGAAGLQQLEQAVHLTFTDADLERVKQMKIHTEELKSEWQQYLDQLGAPITEAQNNMADALLASNYANQKYQEGLDNGTIKTEVSGVALGKLLDKYEKEYYANEKAAEGIKSASEALQAQADAAQKVTDKLNAEISALEGTASAEQALKNANIDTKESQDKITEAQIRARDAARQVAAAQDAYNVAVREHGKNSPEAKAALDALTLAQINARKAADDVAKAQEDQYQSYLKAAEAARKLQAEQDKANDVTGLQAQKAETEKLIDTLQLEADSLAPNSPLRKRLQDYIDMLKSQVPAEVSTKYLIEYKAVFDAPGGRSGTAHYASGGRPPLDKASEVGEQGVEVFTPDEPDRPQLLIGTKGPQMFVPPEPGIITPHGAEPPPREGEQAPEVRVLPLPDRKLEPTPTEGPDVAQPAGTSKQRIPQQVEPETVGGGSAPVAQESEQPAGLREVAASSRAGDPALPRAAPVAVQLATALPRPSVEPVKPAVQLPAGQEGSRALTTSSPPSAAGRLPASPLGLRLRPSAGESPAPSYLPVASNPIAKPIVSLSTSHDIDAPVPLVIPPMPAGSAPSRPLSVSAPTPLAAQVPRQDRPAPAAAPTAPVSALPKSAAALLSLPVIAAPAGSAPQVRTSTPTQVAVPPHIGNLSPRAEAMMPIKPAATVLSSNTGASAPPSIPDDLLAQLKELVGAASASSTGTPQMAHVTVDQPIVLDDQVIGRIVDRRIAEFTRAGQTV